MRYEIQCELPDNTIAPLALLPIVLWVTVDWAHDQKRVDEVRERWQKKGRVRVFDTEKPKPEKKERRRRRDDDDDYGY